MHRIPLCIAGALALLLVLPAAAQRRTGSTPATTSKTIACPGMIDQPLQPLPEIRSSGGVLRGTLYTVSEYVTLTVPPAPGADLPLQCAPTWVRAYRKDPPGQEGTLLQPLPGPVLRARVGEMVNLTFINNIDPTHFFGVDDFKCDEAGGYPGRPPHPPNPDRYPDCFAGSVITNMHYHGSHASPNTTADNVFLQVMPSPRKDGKPIITAEAVREPFDEFFRACDEQLRLDPGPKIWPRIWSDLPERLQELMTGWVGQYAPREWAKTNENLIRNGNWPQYFVGAYPYCFRIPKYERAEWPPAPVAALHTPHTGGRGHGEIDEAKAPARPLVMGQSPGTHWYHAHKHGSTTINIMNGMTGAFVIEGPYDDEINRFYGHEWTRKQPLLVVNQLAGLPALMVNQGGGPGPPFSVNGRLQPVIRMKGGEVQMWRIVNSAARSGMLFPAPKHLQWKQLAQDGVQFSPANYARRTSHELQLASGNRADLLVKAPPFNSGRNAVNRYPVYVYNTVDPSDRPPQKPSAARLTLLTVEVTGDGPEMQFIPEDRAPAFPPFLKNVEDHEIRGTKVLTFASTPLERHFPLKGALSRHTIDGKLFDGELGAVVELNRSEEWKIVNATFPPANINQVSHPFHIHVNPFQVTEIFDPNEPMSHAAGVGTVTIENGEATVEGKGTAFRSTFRAGDFLWIEGPPPEPGAAPFAPPPAIVQSIDSDTQLTVNFNYATPAKNVKRVTGLRYRSAVPRYTIDAANPRPGQCVLDPDDPNSWKPCHTTVPAKERVWNDVFPIPSGSIFTKKEGTDGLPISIPGWFKMRSRFADFSGYFVLHCHILAHEDRGMMTVVQIAPLQTPYSHH